jgi:hypothetical protein
MSFAASDELVIIPPGETVDRVFVLLEGCPNLRFDQSLFLDSHTCLPRTAQKDTVHHQKWTLPLAQSRLQSNF